MKTLLALLMLPAAAFAAPVPKAKPVPPLPAAVAKAWIEAGADAEVGWWVRGVDGTWTWADSPDGASDAYPIFRFGELKADVRTLPPVGRPFGIVVIKSGLPADFLDRIPDARNVVHLAVYKSQATLVENPPEPVSVTDDDVRRAARFTSLRHLSVECSEVGDAGLAHLKGLTSLAELEIGHTKVTDAGLKHLAGLRSLASLRLVGSPVTEAGLEHLAALDGLERLELDMPITAAGAGHLRRLRNVRRLTCLFMKDTDHLLAGAAGMERLADLEMIGCTLTQKGMAHFGKFGRLTRLVLDDDTTYPQTGIRHLAALPRIEELRLDAADAAAGHLGRLTTLKVLSIGEPKGGKLTDRGMARLRGLTNLETLYAGGRMGDRGVETIAGFAKLKTLDLGGTRVTDAGLAHLAALKHLAALDLSNTAVTDAGLAHLADLKSLATLNLYQTRITDAGVPRLRAFPALTDLDLRKTKVTNASLEPLKGFHALAWLGVEYDVIGGDNNYRALRAALPNCKFRH